MNPRSSGRPTHDDASARRRQLTLLGTVHTDPRGFQKTLRALCHLQPDTICVELSAFGWAFRLRHRSYFMNLLKRNLKIVSAQLGKDPQDLACHPDIVAIRNQLTLPFEYRAARVFTVKNRARLLLIDHCRFSKAWIADWPELVSLRNLEYLAEQHVYRMSVAEQYRLASLFLSEASMSAHVPALFLATASREEQDARENHLATQVQKAHQSFRSRHTLYLGGWQHLVNIPRHVSLRSLLAPAKPLVVLIDQFAGSTSKPENRSKSN